MLNTFTAKYTRISSGYMGQLIDWPEIITEGKYLEDCRESLQDALQEMIAAYRQQKKEIPLGRRTSKDTPNLIALRPTNFASRQDWNRSSDPRGDHRRWCGDRVNKRGAVCRMPTAFRVAAFD